jgi:hypothetical protein
VCGEVANSPNVVVRTEKLNCLSRKTIFSIWESSHNRNGQLGNVFVPTKVLPAFEIHATEYFYTAAVQKDAEVYGDQLHSELESGIDSENGHLKIKIIDVDTYI